MNNLEKDYVVQMEEVVTNDDSTETINVWEDFYDCTTDLEEAKANANELIAKIKQHKVEEIFEVEDPCHTLEVCIAVYKKDDNTILDVIEMGEITPDEWNVKCGDCGAYCSEGTCFKYGERVDENQIAESCWHSL